MAEWYETFFDDLAFAVWREVVPAELTAAETAFLLRHLAGDSGDGGDGGGKRRLLDVPCGEGRVAVPLAEAGHEVVGVDQSPEAVEHMRQAAAAAAAGGTVTGIVGDMRSLGAALAGQAPFDGACCMGNSFGYLNSRDTAAFAAAVGAALAPGGPFVLDASIAAEAVLPLLADHDRYEEGDAVLDTVNSYDALQSTMITHMTLEAGGRREQRVVRHRVMTCREIVEVLEAGGLDVDEIYGSLDDEPFTLGAERCVVVATRRR
jgi:SAM-dependent methyltransferase